MAQIIETFRQVFPGKPTWSIDDLPDQSGRVVIKNAKVYLLARSEDKALAAIEDLKQKTNKSDIHFIKLDLADLTSIKQSVKEFTDKESQLHVLFNNAGVMFTPNGSKTPQGWEMQLGTNVLGPILLTQLLLPTLIATAQECSGEAKEKGSNIVRIVNTSSMGNIAYAPSKGGFEWSDPNLGFKDTQHSYGQSKFVNVAHADHLSRKYGDQGISAHSLNPGTIDSDLARHASGLFNLLVKPTLYPVEFGRLNSLWAGLTVEAGRPEENGSYYVPWGRKGKPNSAIKDIDNVEKM
ncbi:hypothetical protein I302_107500 [Kwoniella bestiolae CBS 10118]|uniref:Short-chain dehydrogenase n=1 Tax=Kwoniella bestiolae CBS 10118 TaxID=1296100 RepID=A0A1B9FYD3_9TREE|nr:hypothetical protein I302_06759 [Kwoniella bestiolae CBS 10118]OCF23775.1 hypothetical protein I302_06759 [Kwoniella bestiolae CBS 10118]